MLVPPKSKCTFVISGVRCDKENSLPCHYAITSRINPHMRPGSTCIDLAEKEHDHLKEILLKLGARLIEVPYVCGQSDSPFIKDNALLIQTPDNSVAVSLTAKYLPRKQEQEAREIQLSEAGFQILRIAFKGTLEGGDIVCSSSPGKINAAFVGTGFRSDPADARTLFFKLGLNLTLLTLVDPYLYHLDTAFCLLKDGVAIACKDAFTQESWQTLIQSPWIDRLISVTREEALQFACNLVQVNQTLLMGNSHPRIQRELSCLGYEVIIVPLTQFHQAGGSAACLVNQVIPHSVDHCDLPLAEWHLDLGHTEPNGGNSIHL